MLRDLRLPELFRALERLREELLREVLFEPRFFGTFAPRLRASDKPMAIACFRLFTFLPERPLFNFPRLYSCIALLTLRFDVFPYLAIASPLEVRDNLCMVRAMPRVVYQ